MILNMVGGGGGGAGFNFSVKAYASESALPSVEKENTIAVVTETDITSWIFSATEPESPEEGMVWITVGASSSAAFSATKKNPIMVYPISAKQYVNGAWVDKEAKSYQGGAWVDWIVYLYNKGAEYTGLTGGWTSDVVGTTAATTKPDCTKKESSLRVSMSGKGSGGWAAKNKIDFTNVNAIEINMTDAGLSVNGWIFFAVCSSLNGVEQNIVAVKQFTITPTPGIVRLSTEEVTGEHYFAVAVYTFSGSAWVEFDEVKLLQ